MKHTLNANKYNLDGKERAANYDRSVNVPIHKATTIAEFVLDAHDPQICGNLLDLQNLRAQCPTWMK